MSTYTPIASVTLSSAQSSVTFSGIPQNYTDLVLVVNSSNTPNNAGGIRFNDDSGNNYSLTRLYAVGSSASSDRASNQNHIYLTIGSTTSNQLTTTQISNYANSSVYKTVLMRISATPADFAAAQTALWRNTNAITSITFFNPTGGTTFNSGSTFNLYGVANASITNVAKATGGDSVYTDGTYWYHIFRSTGVFTPTQALTADYLVVAGGGGGGKHNGGGGGAGGMRCTVTATGGGGSLESALSLGTSAYAITVGAGGAAGTGGFNVTGSSGGSSSISGSGITTVTSAGGGGGGGEALNGATGGSGGGGGANTTTGGAGTANQGYAGANGGGGASGNLSGGGGGAGATGTTGSSGGGNGGNGVATSISGSSVTYAGGGGGGGNNGSAGNGGTGGGANGGQNNGTANLGGGGGGGNGGAGLPGGNGGSGIVIVRYAA